MNGCDEDLLLERFAFVYLAYKGIGYTESFRSLQVSHAIGGNRSTVIEGNVPSDRTGKPHAPVSPA